MDKKGGNRDRIDTYEIHPRKDKRCVDLISDALLFGLRTERDHQRIGYADHYSRSHDAVIRAYNEAGNVIATQRQYPSLLRRDCPLDA